MKLTLLFETIEKMSDFDHFKRGTKKSAIMCFLSLTLFRNINEAENRQYIILFVILTRLCEAISVRTVTQ